MHLRCPHCQNPIELADLPAGGEITCTGCGSSFQLASMATASWKNTESQRIGKFEILSTLGQGAFGTVYKARDTELDRTVAIKIPRAGNVGTGQEDVDRFLREARAVAQLRFPSIITIHEVGMENGAPFLVSDFVEGLTLADVLTGRRLTFQESTKLLAEVADALQYAHSLGVIHRDVKPSNIMVRDEGSGPRGEPGNRLASRPSSLTPVLMDFGLAKRDAGEITMTMDGQILGTPAYMSPEQGRGDAHKVDGRSDVYSLGVILYQLLTGELPFRGNKAMLLHQVLHEEPKPPRSLNDKIPRDLETIALKAMAKEPGRRYGSAKEMAEDLRRWLAGEPILARPIGRIERAWRWTRRNPVPALVTACAVILFIGTSVSTYFAVTAYQEKSRALAAGALDITDQNELHVRREGLSGKMVSSFVDARTFTWRVFVPAKGKFRWVTCISSDVTKEPSQDGHLFPFPFEDHHRGKESLITLTLARGRSPHTEWHICPYTEGNHSAPAMRLAPIVAEVFDRRGMTRYWELDASKTYRTSAKEHRVNLVRWDRSNVVGNAFDKESVFGGLMVWLEKATPDGTFSGDSQLR